MYAGIQMGPRDLSLPMPTRCRRSAPSGAVAIVASAGGIPALFELLTNLPRDFALPIFIAQHLARGRSVLDKVLSLRSGLSVGWAINGATAREGEVYLVPPGMTLSVNAGGFVVRPLAQPSASWLSSGDELISSLIELYGSRTAAIVLSGMLPAGLKGLRAINACGGITMAQTPSTAEALDMPSAAIDLGKANIVLPPWRLAHALRAVAHQWALRESA